MAATNDLIYEKLVQEFPAEGKHIGDLIKRYRKGDVYLNLPGIVGNDYVFTNSGSTSHPTSITGRIWIAADVAMDDWTPAAAQTLVARYTVLFSLKSYMLQILTTGAVRAIYSPDGAADRIFDSTVNLSAQGNGSRLAVGVDINPSDGGNRTATFYTAPSIDGPWSQLGAVVSQVGAESIAAVNTNTQLAAHVVLAPSGHTKGKMYAAEIRNGGISGTIVAKPRFDRASELGHVDVDDGYGNKWLVPGNASSWLTSPLNTDGTPDLDFGTTDLDVRIKVAQADWTHTGVTHWFVNHGFHTAVVPDLSWAFTVHSDGRLRTAISADGTNFIGPVTTNPVGFTDGTEHFLRTTVDLDDGAGNSVFSYYESLDDGLTWTPIEAGMVDPAGPIVLFNTNFKLTVQGIASTTQTTKYLEIRKGINGPIVVKADFTKAHAGDNNFIDETDRNWANGFATGVGIVEDATAIPKWEDYVAHVAGASLSLNVGDDENAFWNAFVP